MRVKLFLACDGAQTRFVGMMQYDGDLKLPARFLVPPPAIHGVSGKLLADAGVTTFACSETQKFGHVRAQGLPPRVHVVLCNGGLVMRSKVCSACVRALSWPLRYRWKRLDV